MRPIEAGHGESVDAKAFLDHVRKKGRPGLVALAGNAFRCRRRGSVVTLHFDKRHANLIPMLKSPQNLRAMGELSEDHFGHTLEVQFAIGSDPNMVAQQKREDEALEIVKSNPVVKFLVDHYKGTIVNCQIMESPEE